MAETIDARVKQKTGVAADFAGYTLLEGEMALVRTSASGPVINYKVGPGLFDSLPWSLQVPGTVASVSPSTDFSGLPAGLYLPEEDGTYDGSVSVDLTEGVTYLNWDGSTLTKQVYPINLAGYATINDVDSIIPYDLYRDRDQIFDLSDSGYAGNYSFTSSLGYIRTLDRGGQINRLSFYIGKNENTAATITATIGTVPSVGAFSYGSETVLGTFDIDANDLPLDDVALMSFDMAPINVNSGDNLVVLFSTPTVMATFQNSVEGYSMLYRTVAIPGTWNYGFRKSSGIAISFNNAGTEDYVKRVSEETIAASDPFKEMKIVTMGDSITAHAGSWANLLFSKYGSDFVNLAVSGARFRDTADTITSVNLLNPDMIVTGFWLNQSAVESNAPRKISGNINIVGNVSKQVTVSGMPTTRWSWYWQILDAGLNVIENGFFAGGEGTATTSATATYTTDNGTYFRITVYSARAGETDESTNVQIELGGTATAFVPYAATPGTVIDMSGTMGANNTAFNQILRLAQKLTPLGDPIVITNPISGESFTVPTGTAVGTGDFQQPDLIVIAMGTNDEVFDYPETILRYKDFPVTKINRTENLVAGMRWFIEMLINLCPNAQIIFSTPIQSNPTGSRRFVITKTKRARIVEVCNYYATPYIDAFTESGIAEKWEVASAQGRYLSDGLHPDDNGKALMARFMKKRIENYLI